MTKHISHYRSALSVGVSPPYFEKERGNDGDIRKKSDPPCPRLPRKPAAAFSFIYKPLHSLLALPLQASNRGDRNQLVKKLSMSSASGALDRWTRKLREKSQSLLSAAKGGAAADTAAADGSPGWLSPAFHKAVPVTAAAFYSESSLAMLVECFSP
ncbi:hypothetical protein SAY87_025626 [Trapa incisa]|uniref:Uncharacterized protein n=1 Tax=Trapa incisa TaxID=236973 RepID=A0AAN7JJ85_9MYRT|nr:hypothetical protein SAY87_025626 [Trapa incisa]